MTTLISTCNTKTEFRDRVRAGMNITMFDPSLDGRHGRMVDLRSMQDNVGHSVTVTNKRRSWFAEVTVKEGRRLTVK
jgi:hypothetical protein